MTACRFPSSSMRGQTLMPAFQLVSPFQPAGDQPQAIEKLVAGLPRRASSTRCCWASPARARPSPWPTSSPSCGKPTLVLSHNKTLAAQLYEEFKEFFPHNAVHYFVSYYDYYQPEAYIPQRDIYIEKDALDQRGDRPPAAGGHQRPGQPRGRDRRRQRVVHLRPGLARGLQAMMVRLQRGRDRSTATRCC